MKKFYIAYGSNLNIEQMSQRCPTATIWKKGILYEGYPSFYYKKNIEATLDNGEIITGIVYIMNPQAVPGIPSKTYLKTIYDGYLDNNLDISYLNHFLST